MILKKILMKILKIFKIFKTWKILKSLKISVLWEEVLTLCSSMIIVIIIIVLNTISTHIG